MYRVPVHIDSHTLHLIYMHRWLGREGGRDKEREGGGGGGGGEGERVYRVSLAEPRLLTGKRERESE